MARVLITGGLGYVGGYLSRHLAGLGDAVRITTRRDPSGIAAPPAGCEIVQADMTNDGALAAAVKDCDTVIHLANWNAAQCGADPEGAMVFNAGGTARLIAIAEAAGVKRFVYFSSVHVYGANMTGSVDETTRPVATHPYATTHLAAEEIVRKARAANRIDGLVVRLSNGVGAPKDDGVDCWTVIVNDLCRQAVTTGRIVLNSPGDQERDFVPLPDVARAVGHLLRLPGEAWGDGMFHIGSGHSMTIFAMAERIADRCQALFGSRPVIERPEPGLDTPPPFHYSVDRLAATGFRWTASLNDEIDAILTYAKGRT